MKSVCYYRVYVINYSSKNSTTLIFINLNLRDTREKKISINRCHQYTSLNLNTKSEGKGRVE